MIRCLLLVCAASCLAMYNAPLPAAEATERPAKSEVKPLKVLLVTGGCCHDYKKQKDILKEGLEARAHVSVEHLHSDSDRTDVRFEKYTQPDWAAGYDVVIHDECISDIPDKSYIDAILRAHRGGVPAVNLHCAMHSYRLIPREDQPAVKPGTDEAMWFEFVGLQSNRHGPQLPIKLTILPTGHPITEGLKDWTTIREELYNNIQIFDGSTPLIRGTQQAGDKPGENDVVVAWTHLYGDAKTRVFSTTLGHNTQTVADDRYLQLVTRGLLWACDKLNDDYLKPFKPSENSSEAEPGPQPTPAKPAQSR